jgi:tetratricopeptide (TPR) repeat protein
MGSLPPKEAASRARAAARKAIELDEALADGHASLAFTLARYDWNWADAEGEFKRAIDLGPGDSRVYSWYSEFLRSMGRSDEAKAYLNRAQDIDPFGVGDVRSIAGSIARPYFEAKQYDQGIEAWRKAIDLIEPDSFRARMDLAGTCLGIGRYEDAIAEYQKVISLYGRNVYPLAQLGYAYALLGRPADAEKILNELRKRSRPGYPSFASAQICTSLGRKEEALKWLRKAYAERAPQMVRLNREPAFGSLRSDPRFRDLVRHVGLPLNEMSK